MEEFGLKYRVEIANIETKEDFEKIGDALFLNHEDPEARMTWAFYRPSGSAQIQIEDSNPLVSIMAFNNSRLRPLERFAKLHKDVLRDESLRVRVAKRARMLFRALADEDFRELAIAIERYPIYTQLACDQIINGRKMLEDVRADLLSASRVIELTKKFRSKELLCAVCRKVAPLDEMTILEIKNFIDLLLDNKKDVCNILKSELKTRVVESINSNSNLHLLQKKAIESRLKGLDLI